MILEILTHTPVWVFALFAYLAWIGIQRLRPSVRRISAVWIVPLFFIAWGLSGLFTREAPIAPWLLGAVLGAALGAGFPQPVQIDRKRGLVRQAGSVVPLLRNLFLFASHYVLRVAMAIDPAMHSTLLAADLAVSGFGAGYFAGWAIRFLIAWRRAPDVDLAPAPA